MKDYNIYSWQVIACTSRFYFTLHKFLFFSLHCQLFSLHIFSKNGYLFIGYRWCVINSWSVVKCTNVVNLVWKPSNEKSFAFSFRCLSFSPSNKSGLGKLWQILDFMFTFEDLIFRWTLYKVDISIKQTLVMHQWCPFYRDSTVAS